MAERLLFGYRFIRKEGGAVFEEYIERLRLCGVRPDHAWAIVNAFTREGNYEGLEQYVKDCENGFHS